ncbi:MAG TPA: trypco2 family protein [Bauldia sp.]|nr:trypco2 family protein [Bauldia sp.]
MDLREFVSQTLAAIIGGVADVQETDHGKLVGQTFRFSLDQNKDIRGLIIHGSNNYAIVEFDVAVSSSNSASGGAKVEVLSVLSLGAKGDTTNTTASRIKFSVPIKLPQVSGT